MDTPSLQQPPTTTENLPAAPAEERKLAPNWAKEIIVTDAGIKLQTFDDLVQVATTVHKSGLAPKAYDSVPKIIVCFSYGLEMGFSPMQALQSIAVINNRPCLWGDALPGLVKAKNKLEDRREWFTGSPFDDDYTAHAEYKRVGEVTPYTAEFSVADAKTAKLWGKVGKYGDPTPWVTYPKRMLKVRARAFAIRDGFADVLCGFGVAEEQLDVRGYEPEQQPDRRVVDNPQYLNLKAALNGKAGCENDNDRDAVVSLATKGEFTTLASLDGNEDACGKVLAFCQSQGWENVLSMASQPA